MVKNHDLVTLSDLGIKAGLEKDEIETVLHSDAYGEAVKQDIEMAQNRSSRSSFLRLRQ
jgi:protein disulfide-isomerase